MWPFINPQRCELLGQAERDWWCAAIADAGTPLTVANQQQPQNQWTVHPFVDGCQPEGDDTNGEWPPVV